MKNIEVKFLKYKSKEKKGITLITLVLTVTLMIILASVATYSGIDTYKKSKVNKFVYQMQLIQAKIDDITENEKNELIYDTKYDEIIEKAKGNDEINSESINSDFKKLDKNDLLKKLDIEDIEEDILVNFETKEVINTVGIDYENEDGETIHYYTQYKLPGGQKIINGNNGPERKLNETNNFDISKTYDGLNCIVSINKIYIQNGTLEYELNGSNLENITNYTETSKTYNVNISKSGAYSFKLKDNTTKDNSFTKTVIITTTNRPKTSSTLNLYDYSLDDYGKWAIVDDYIWIPRFVYKNDDVKFIKGNSNIATDNSYVDDSYTLPDIFKTYDTTGVWVKIPEGYDGSEKNKKEQLLDLLDTTDIKEEI